MPQTDTLHDHREQVAQFEYEHYDYGTREVEGQDGWEYTTPGRVMRRAVYLSVPESPSEKTNFTVQFATHDNAKVVEVYASDSQGNPIGARAGMVCNLRDAASAGGGRVPQGAGITRSPGLLIPGSGCVAGGGVHGATAELDALAERAAALLREAYARDVTIRFNSNRLSGGAWLVTHQIDSFGANAELGIRVALRRVSEADNERFLALGLEAMPLGESLEIHAYVGTRSLRSPAVATNMLDDPERRYALVRVESLEAGLAFLQANGILREDYSTPAKPEDAPSAPRRRPRRAR